MKTLKHVLSVGLIALTMGAAMPARQAQAGIILCPVLIGIVILVIGIEDRDTLLIVLDADGNVSQDALEGTLAKAYPFVDNRDAIRNLAVTIREKAEAMPLQDSKKTVRLTRDEVLRALEPTGLVEVNPAATERLVQALM